MANKYIVTALFAGPHNQGDIIDGSSKFADQSLDRWIREGAVREATADEVKAAAEADKAANVPGADGLTGARAASEATGDDKIAETAFREAHAVEEPTVGAEKPASKK
jgi:hypothetical protein